MTAANIMMGGKPSEIRGTRHHPRDDCQIFTNQDGQGGMKSTWAELQLKATTWLRGFYVLAPSRPHRRSSALKKNCSQHSKAVQTEQQYQRKTPTVIQMKLYSNKHL